MAYIQPHYNSSVLCDDISICYYVVLSLNSSGIRFVAAVSCELFKVTIPFEVINVLRKHKIDLMTGTCWHYQTFSVF